ncbi:MAG: hypothetical protein HY611_02635, partial [Elusimicrobia bacterium]|nr:hypothetical protein [Elusimicrobiota bacterium]
LKDIVAAGEDGAVYNFQSYGDNLGNRTSVPASVAAPSVLVEEMELKKTEQKPDKPPYLTNAYFGN